MRILHLYPDLMNLYGDYGNITVLKKHLEDQGEKVKVERKEINQVIDFSRYDFVYMGSGTHNNMLAALDAFRKFKHMFKLYLDNGGIALFTGNAVDLLGNKIDDHNGLGILDFETHTTEKRFTGDVVVHNSDFGSVVGFINKSSIVEGATKNALFTYEFKDNNLPDEQFEGYRYYNLFATHIIGPVLVKNPPFMKYLVRLLADENYQEMYYENESRAYDVNIKELRKRK